MGTMAKAVANEHGVTWAGSKSGALRIAVGPDEAFNGERVVRVWALYTGSHDLAPGARNFTGTNRDRNARAYANRLWATR